MTMSLVSTKPHTVRKIYVVMEELVGNQLQKDSSSSSITSESILIE